MLTAKPLNWFKPDPKQPRKSFDEDDLRRLGESLKERQNDPIQAKADGSIIDGWRRWMAAKLVALEKLDVIVTEQPLTENQLRVIRLTSFFHKADLKAVEKWEACAELMCDNPTWQLKDLAEHLHLDPSSLTRILSPSRCSTAWQEALADGKVGLSDCYQASLVSAHDQDALLSLKLAGASRDDIARVSRQKRKGTATAIRLARVKIAMPHGATVVISGSQLSMSEVVELLNETLKEARKAAEQYDVKTFQSMMRDRAIASR